LEPDISGPITVEPGWRSADNPLVTDQPWTWIFTRGDDRLQLRRVQSESEYGLIIEDGTGAPRHYRFDDEVTLVNFQGDMEEFLLKTGWAFSEFSPERRTGRERRTWPRMRDRRRWWTDGLVAASLAFVGRGKSRRSGDS
jgi:hypothetical protein